MATGSTMYVLNIDLSHVDRSVYETFELRVPMHPSESPSYFVTRVLAYCLEYTEGIAFSRGVSDADDPTLAVRDLTGALQVWIEIGAPDAARVHKASKAAPRMTMYTHRDVAQVQKALAGTRIHRAEHIVIHAIDRSLIDAVADALQRRMSLSVAVTDGTLYITCDGVVHTGAVTAHPIAL